MQNARMADPDAADKPKSAPQKAMEKMGLKRDVDLALHLPLRYEDETRLTAIGDLRQGQSAQCEGVVRETRVELRPRRQLIVRLQDASGELILRFLHFYPSHQKTLVAGARIRTRGEVRGGFFGYEMVHPAFKPVDDETPLATALTPVYPTSAALPQAYLRKAVAGALGRAHLVEVLPPHLVRPGLPTLREALHSLHHPSPHASLEDLEHRSSPAWQRLKWEELLAQQISQLMAQRERASRQAPSMKASPGGLPEQLLAALPFDLTGAQRRVVEEIAQDLARSEPMHRLLQGDVGSGKTVVAALAAAVAIDAGWQCALMAPTEILAEQHFRKLVGWLSPLLEARGQCVAWLTGSVKGKARQAMMDKTGSGEAALVVGTQAVIQDSVQFARLGLALIDEQHRFGVAQRLALRQKLEGSSLEPHLLMMTATPIPRTLAMTYYADLSVSTIDELPPGRTPIVTKVFADTRRPDVIERIREEVRAGRQVYWVCPLIEESEALDLRNATATHEELSAALTGVRLPDGSPTLVGLLHSRMPAAEKKAVMALFEAGAMSVLVSTTVIEVGVDVPNASLMVIEHAERFGLSQLHQLRGRVGRGTAASACVLLYSTGDAPRLGETARARLKAMSETNDGFEIARRDLEIRGPGEFMGARQSGAPLLRFADLATDTHLLDWARSVAPRLLAQHPERAAAHVARWLGGKAEFLKA